MEKVSVVEEMKVAQTAARADCGTVANMPLVCVRMKLGRITSQGHVKGGHCMRMAHTEALTYISRNQAERITVKEYDAYITKKAREVQEKG